MKLVPPKASASGHVSSDSVVVERHLFPQLGRLVLWMTPAVVLVNDLHEAAFSLHYPTASRSALHWAIQVEKQAQIQNAERIGKNCLGTCLGCHLQVCVVVE